ncbi:hypothetical protein AMTR_s00028p00082870 [Amborella trichopoda]|uniref:Uncharacterized protein n=1 Tax=Amborella trichopoda TaxID=13333 RepID=W1PKM6_AMBTC|nr:hypothetical protein AMTR_s00028p00082870 [Amborella trichopoda]
MEGGLEMGITAFQSQTIEREGEERDIQWPKRADEGSELWLSETHLPYISPAGKSRRTKGASLACKVQILARERGRDPKLGSMKPTLPIFSGWRNQAVHRGFYLFQSPNYRERIEKISGQRKEEYGHKQEDASGGFAKSHLINVFRGMPMVVL